MLTMEAPVTRAALVASCSILARAVSESFSSSRRILSTTGRLSMECLAEWTFPTPHRPRFFPTRYLIFSRLTSGIRPASGTFSESGSAAPGACFESPPCAGCRGDRGFCAFSPQHAGPRKIPSPGDIPLRWYCTSISFSTRLWMYRRTSTALSGTMSTRVLSSRGPGHTRPTRASNW